MNELLRSELLAMQKHDLDTRAMLIDKGQLHNNDYHPLMKSVHLQNNSRIKALIERHGWPLQSEVGQDGAQAAWLIVQHAVLELEFQQKCLDLLEKAIAIGEAEGWCLAYLHDRVLTSQGKLQIYGTQHEEINGRIRPIKTQDPAGVDSRRRLLQMPSQKDHTNSLQAEYDQCQSNK